jgi:hypothetical protein
MFYKPEYIYLHHSLTKDSGTVSWSAIRKYHIYHNGWDDIGYHYGIEIVGTIPEIFVGRFEGRPGAHVRGHNKNSIGICLVGNYNDKKPGPEKWNLLMRLVKNIAFRYAIPVENVLGHREINSNKTCPGTMFDLYKFRDYLSREL